MDICTQLVKRFSAVSETLEKLLDGVSDVCFTTFPGERVNNMAWQIGHITLTRTCFIEYLCPERRDALILTDAERCLFDQGGQPPKSPAAYPSRERLVLCFRSVDTAWIAFIKSLTPDDLERPFGKKGDPLADLMTFLLTHESYHLGQIGFIRSFYGYDRVFG